MSSAPPGGPSVGQGGPCEFAGRAATPLTTSGPPNVPRASAAAASRELPPPRAGVGGVGALLPPEVVLHHVAVALLLDALGHSVQHLDTEGGHV